MPTGTVKWSPGLEAIHGLAPSTFPGTFAAFRDEIHPEDRDRVLQAIESAVTQRRDHHVQYRIVRADGHVRWVEGRGQLFLDAAQQPDRIVGVCADITERKQAEERLAEQAALLESIDDAVCEMDAGLRITDWNPAAERMFGYAAGEAIGVNAFEILQWMVTAEERAAFVRHVEASEILRTEAELRTKQGATVWSDVTVIAKRRPDGALVRFIAVHRDITARKRADELFRLAVEAAPAAMILVDRQGTIVMLNALTEPLLGYGRDEIIGQSIEQLVPARFRGNHPAHREYFGVHAQRRPMGAGRDLYALRKDGSEVPVEIGLSPIETVEGWFVLAAVTDISERKQVEEQRAQLLVREQTSRTEMERAGQLKDEFLAVLSHELRTPLNAVLGYAQLLGTDALSAEGTSHAIAAIRRNAQAQARLVESLLDLSRIMAGKLELDVEHLDVARLVDAAVDVVRPDAKAKEIRLDVVMPTVVSSLAGDSGRLQQVFGNVLSNAIKFTPRGGRVGVQVVDQGDRVSIQISDTGRGIGADFLPYVFDRFKQADDPTRRSRAGLGLGLALVREMVQAHGGTVEAESPGDGQGSTFTITLPLSIALPAQSDDSGSAAWPETVSESLARLDIVLVDDHADARDLLSLLLQMRGATVRSVSSAAGALEAIALRRPDVLLADVGMPDVDGYSLIRKVRANDRQRGVHLPAIAVTAYATIADRERAIAEGYDGHVAKPVDPHALARTIARVVKTPEA
jgi:PAS domain S-box-containing protein